MDKIPVNEQTLIAGCRHNKASAQKQIYELYAPRMLGVCVRYVGNAETARDVLQEGFIKLFAKIGTYAGGSFYAWTRRIFVNTALETLRRQNVLRFAQNIDDYNEVFEDADPSIADKISANDLMNHVAALPEGYRTVFNLYAIEGYSHAEIGAMLKIGESTSRSQFSKARKLLREKIEKDHARQQ